MIEGHRSSAEMCELVQSGHWLCVCGEVVTPGSGPTASAELASTAGGASVMIGGHASCVDELAAELFPDGKLR